MKLDEFLNRQVDITWIMYPVRVWCWIIGHDTVCLKRHTQERDGMPWTTTSAHQCLRCGTKFMEQWDE
jgi:hypothetical protein